VEKQIARVEGIVGIYGDVRGGGILASNKKKIIEYGVFSPLPPESRLASLIHGGSRVWLSNCNVLFHSLQYMGRKQTTELPLLPHCFAGA
jgi:hypothetical protein